MIFLIITHFQINKLNYQKFKEVQKVKVKWMDFKKINQILINKITKK